MKKAWLKEPDILDFNVYGFPCRIMRNPDMKFLCGYIGVPNNHPWFEQTYVAVDANAHGGLTYSGKKPTINFYPDPPPGHWWIGFDCAHAGDLIPQFSHRPTSDDDHYRTLEFVLTECIALAYQAWMAPRPIGKQ